MKNLYPILFLLLLCPIGLRAQSNFKTGYIVNLKGDTVKGITTKTYFNDKLDGTVDNELLYRTILTNLTAKAGVSVANKVDVYLGYCSPLGITNYPQFGFDITTYRAGINYLFGKK